MKNNCIEDRIEMAQEIAEVRKTSRVNMFDRAGVADVLGELDYPYTADYIMENRDDYLELLEMSSNY